MVSPIPRLLIVGGPNGSGKTTLALEYANEYALPYVGADAIAATLNPPNPAAARIPAARQFVHTLESHIVRRESLICESTLSGLTMQKFFASARDAGYVISVAFLFVDSPDVCLARVAERVRAGGHSVPESDIRRRFGRSVRNFWKIYRELADNWVLLYNGLTMLQDVAVGSGTQTVVRDPEQFAAFFKPCWGIAMTRSQLSADTYAAIDEVVRVGNRGVAKAQENNRRLGVPNVYAINGRLYYETSAGELSATDPGDNALRATEQTKE